MVREEFEAACLRALTRCGMKAEGFAKDLCPVDTGLLQNSITYALAGKSAAISSYKADKPDKSGETKSGAYSGSAPTDSDGEMSVYIGTNVEYAVPLETRRQKPLPFLKPAVADHAQTYRNIIEEELKGG